MAQGMQDLVTLSQAMSSFAQSVNALHKAKVEAETGKYLIQRSRAQAEFLNRMNKMEINDGNWETEFGNFRDQMSSQIESIKDEKVRYGVAKQVVPLDDEFMVQLSNKYAEHQVRGINAAHDESITLLWSNEFENVEDVEAAYTASKDILSKQLLHSDERKQKEIANERMYKIKKLYTESRVGEAAPWKSIQKIRSGEFDEDDQRIVDSTVGMLTKEQESIDSGIKEMAKGYAQNGSTIGIEGLRAAREQIIDSSATAEAKAASISEINSAINKEHVSAMNSWVAQSDPAYNYEMRDPARLMKLKKELQDYESENAGIADDKLKLIAKVDSWLKEYGGDGGLTIEKNKIRSYFDTLIQKYRAKARKPDGSIYTAGDLLTYAAMTDPELGLREELRMKVENLDILTPAGKRTMDLLSKRDGILDHLDRLKGTSGGAYSWIKRLDKDEQVRLMQGIVNEITTSLETGTFKTDLEIDNGIKIRLASYAVAKDFWGKELMEGVGEKGKPAQKLAPLVAAAEEGRGGMGTTDIYGHEVIDPELGKIIKAAPKAFAEGLEDVLETKSTARIPGAIFGKGSGPTIGEKLGIVARDLSFKPNDETGNVFDGYFIGKNKAGESVKITVDYETLGDRPVTVYNYMVKGKDGKWGPKTKLGVQDVPKSASGLFAPGAVIEEEPLAY